MLPNRPFCLRLPLEMKKKLVAAKRVTGLAEADIVRAAVHKLLCDVSHAKLVHEVIICKTAHLRKKTPGRAALQATLLPPAS